ncbi:DHA2 family efflux MFS transporter permease subunit [Chitinimonas koreensis]|uniref:DHA2 family efflux MFS transporter permease subunit n=1 Tax=Chitinimonas koreensis TaxID=356302 RepID=UPI00040DE965|nr:DHA2 family efflux MFS transporter permease subunit [Chitinimonas koreensis]QNM95659.1 DHA2 family efflux MFS transporter permease subunit [Chitinimonas koreensis]
MSSPQPLPPLKGSQLVWATIALSLATFMNVLDTTIANVSIPSIAGDVGVSPSQGTWVITSFAVANAISVPLTGWLTQRFGQVKLFVTSILLFVLSSLLCGMATSLEMLIAFRVMQGAVAGPMIPLSQALLLASYPKAKSGLALAMWAMTTMVAPVLGPILGGWLSDNLSWPWIFYINIPTGLFAAWLTWTLLRHRESPTRRLPIDKVGLGLLVVWVGALQIMLDKGKELDWFASGEIVLLGVVALVAFAFFLVWELTEKHPIVDLKLFSRANFSVGVTALSLGYGLFFANVVLMPLWLQQYMGYTATWAGLVTAPIGVLALLMSPVIGKNIHRLDVRWVASFSFAVFAAVCFLRAGFSTDSDMGQIVFPQLLQGAAMATFFVPLTALTLSGLTPDRIPAASGLANFVRITFGAFGASVATTVWENRAAHHHARLTEHVTAFDPAAQQALGNLAGAGLNPQQALGALDRTITVQSFTLAADDFFWISGGLFVLLIGLLWLTKPNKAPGGAAADAGGAH